MSKLSDCVRVPDLVWLLCLALLGALALFFLARIFWAGLVQAILNPVRLAGALIKAPLYVAAVTIFVVLASGLVFPTLNGPVLVAKKECVISRMAVQVQWEYRGKPPPKYQQPQANTSRKKNQVNISEPLLAGPQGVTKAKALAALALVVNETPSTYRKTREFKDAEAKARQYILTVRSAKNSKSFYWSNSELKKGSRIDVVSYDGPNNLST